MISRAGNVKLALGSIRSAKWRSFLTMLGIIIGVVSVVTTVSLGEGVKQQISQQSHDRGDDLITVLSGERVERNKEGKIIQVRTVLSSGASLSDLDYRSVLANEDIEVAAPLAKVTGQASTEFKTYQPTVIATTGALPKLLNQSIDYGSFFTDKQREADSAVLGPRVAEELFGENIPMGKSFKFRDKTFVVRGLFSEFASTGFLALNEDYNDAIFIPYDTGRELVAGNMLVEQILAKPKENVSPVNGAEAIRSELLKTHANQEDFTVLTQDELLLVAGSMLNVITAFITAVAAISLIVGGIGIMNIMFVLVTERTREIGVRKAIGATTRQIMNQFLAEALIVSVIGGVAGVLLAILTNFLLRVFTDLQPVITWPVVGIAIFASAAVGVIFGATPALKAAHQDPIESLRYE